MITHIYYIHTYMQTYVFPSIPISSTFPTVPVRDAELICSGFYKNIHFYIKRKLNLSSLNPLMQRISFLHTSSLCLLSFPTIFRTQAL